MTEPLTPNTTPFGQTGDDPLAGLLAGLLDEVVIDPGNGPVPEQVAESAAEGTVREVSEVRAAGDPDTGATGLELSEDELAGLEVAPFESAPAPSPAPRAVSPVHAAPSTGAAAGTAGAETVIEGEGPEQLSLAMLIASVEDRISRAAMKIGDPMADRSSAGSAERCLVFEVREQWLALGLTQVLQVEYLPPFAHLPGVGSTFLGVTNFRGDILPLIDLRAALGLPAQASGKRQKVIVVKNVKRNALAGLVVDGVKGLVPVPEGGARALDSAHRLADWGLGQVEHEQHRVLLLDLERLLESAAGATVRAA